jgi:hypothetical protein
VPEETQAASSGELATPTASGEQAPAASDGPQAPAGDTYYGIWMETESIRGSGGGQAETRPNPAPVESRPNPARRETRQGSRGSGRESS